jgi:hypothetical protein
MTTTKPQRPEIDQYTIKFLIGLIALLLPTIELVLTSGQIDSISQSYWYAHSPWTRNIFVGFLYSIGALLVGYNGSDHRELWFAKVACVSAVVVAMFPCACGRDDREIIPGVHTSSAAAMFLVLAWFCKHFIDRARSRLDAKKKAQVARKIRAKRRIVIYQICGIGMLASFALIGLHKIVGQENWVFWGETIGLYSFGVAWLTASKAAPGFKRLTADLDEQQVLFPLSPVEAPADNTVAPMAAPHRVPYP